MSWDAARAVLDAHFQAMPGLDLDAIEWPNESFAPTSGQPYWRFSLIPAGVLPEMGGGSDHERGILQIDRVVMAGTGIGQALRDCQAVIDWFKRRNLSGVQVGAPFLGSQLKQEPDRLRIPVSIPFQVL